MSIICIVFLKILENDFNFVLFLETSQWLTNKNTKVISNIIGKEFFIRENLNLVHKLKSFYLIIKKG